MVGDTYVLVSDRDSTEIIAYFTISPNIIKILFDKGVRSLANVVKLEYLAVDQKHQNRELGTDLLAYIMGQVAEYANEFPIMALAIEPLNEKARQWFLNRNFGFVSAELPKPCLAVFVETLRSMFDSEQP